MDKKKKKIKIYNIYKKKYSCENGEKANYYDEMGDW